MNFWPKFPWEHDKYINNWETNLSELKKDFEKLWPELKYLIQQTQEMNELYNNINWNHSTDNNDTGNNNK